MDRYEFGKYLANIRHDKGVSLAKWAPKIRLNPSTLQQLEQGNIQQPGLDIIGKIAAGYNLDEQEVEDVYYDAAKKSKDGKYDQQLEEIKKDSKFKFKDQALRALAENMGKETKKFILLIYEEIKRLEKRSS